MQFKKVDVLISENLTKEQLKEKVLTELNKISRASNPRISYIANIHDIFNGKYWICMDSETKETMGAADELIDLQTNLINAHTADFNNPHRTTVSNLTDTTITNPQRNQTLVYDGTKWVNKSVSLDGSNYAKKNEANIFTKKQSGIDGTEDANFVTLRQLKTKVGLTGNETIAGVKTFSSSIVIPNATANNHSLPLGQADSRYAQLLTENLEWTVGTGGTYLTLKQAFAAAEKYVGPYKIIIKIKNGYTQSGTASYNGLTPLHILPENVGQIFNFTGEVWSAFMTFGNAASGIRIFDLKIKGTTSGSIGIAGAGDVSLYRCEFSGNIVPVYRSGGILFVHESFKANLASKNNCFDINVGATMYLKSPKTSTIITNASVAFRADRTAKICINDDAGATINNSTTGFAVTGGGIMSILNKGNNSFSGTPTQYSQAANVATKEGIIFM